jgi:hypothetical protein
VPDGRFRRLGEPALQLGMPESSYGKWFSLARAAGTTPTQREAEFIVLLLLLVQNTDSIIIDTAKCLRMCSVISIRTALAANDLIYPGSKAYAID